MNINEKQLKILYKKHSKITKKISLLLLILLSLFPRITEVLNKNYVFGFDQGRDYLAAWSIGILHKFTLIGPEAGSGSSGILGIFHGPGYYYLLALPVFLLGGNPYYGVVLMFIISIVSIVIGFLLAKKIFGYWGGVLVGLLIAVSPQFISQARFPWSPFPSTLFILLSLYFLYQASQKNSKYMFLSAFFAGFVYNFELANAIPLSIAIILYTISILKIKEIRKYIAMIAGFILAYSPMLIFEIRHKFMATSSIIKYISSPNKKSAHDYSYLLDHLKSFYYNFTDTFPKLPDMFYIILIIVMLVSVIYFLKKEKNIVQKNFILFLILLIPVNYLVYFFLKNSVYTYYLYNLNISYIILFSYIFHKSISDKKTYSKYFMFIILTIIIVAGDLSSIKTFSYDIKDSGGDAKIEGKKDVIDYIYKNAGTKDFGLMVFEPAVYSYDIDYLLEWYAAGKYGYLPERRKKDITYLLIRKDVAKPTSYIGWLETVIKNGKVINTTTLKSGYIVQKRTFTKDEEK